METTADIENILRRYVRIQEDMSRLQEEKKTLQARLADHLEQQNTPRWTTALDGRPLTVRFTRTTEVTYDEDLLRRRLGERYADLLAPDTTKIRHHVAELEDALKPFLTLIGSPSPDRVRQAIESGRMTREEFAGAFTKAEHRRVAVGRPRPDSTLTTAP